MKTSARKFIAQRRFANYGFFEQKPLKKTPKETEVKVTITKSWLKSFGKFVTMPKYSPILMQLFQMFSQIATVGSSNTKKDFYFSTLAEGKNVLQTQQPANLVEGILRTCQTSSLNTSEITPITQLVLKLCDDSVIQALNGSLALNVTVDPALSCIESAFNDGCTPVHTYDSSDGSSDTAYTLIGIVLLAIVLYCCWKKCCGSNNEQAQQPGEDPHTRLMRRNIELLEEQNEILDRPRREEMGRGAAQVITSACTIS